MGIGNNRIKGNYLFWDKRIHRAKSQSYQLLIHYSKQSFSYCIFDIDENEFLGIRSHVTKNTKNLKSLLEKDLFNWSFESIKINIQSNKSTVLPNSFFEKKIIEKYLYFEEDFNENEINISWDELKYMDAIVVYSTSNQIIALIQQKFKKIKIKSHSSVFIDSILRKSAQSKKNEVFIDICKNNFDIGVVKKSKLFLYNNFTFSSENDFLYYVLNCYNTLNLDPKKDVLHVSGEFEKDNFIKPLKEYLHNIILEKKLKGHAYSNVFNKMPEFHFQKLLNLTTCA